MRSLIPPFTELYSVPENVRSWLTPRMTPGSHAEGLFATGKAWCPAGGRAGVETSCGISWHRLGPHSPPVLPECAVSLHRGFGVSCRPPLPGAQPRAFPADLGGHRVCPPEGASPLGLCPSAATLITCVSVFIQLLTLTAGVMSSLFKLLFGGGSPASLISVSPAPRSGLSGGWSSANVCRWINISLPPREAPSPIHLNSTKVRRFQLQGY